MCVFVSEYVCGGAWGGGVADGGVADGSLVVEGRAMLFALAADLLRIPGGEVWITWDRRLGAFPASRFFSDAAIAADSTARSRLAVIESDSPEQEASLFPRLCEQCDACFVIAPEFSGLLEARVDEAAQLTRLVGCHADAVRLCGDKLALSRRLRGAGIATVPTELFDRQLQLPGSEDFSCFPCVIKPRDGAGSLLTFRADGRADLKRIQQELRRDGDGFAFVRQPFVDGLAVSCAAIVGSGHGGKTDRLVQVLPPCEQILSTDGGLKYLGADWPGRLTEAMSAAVRKLVRQCCEVVEGLDAYVGFDVIIPGARSAHRDDSQPQACEPVIVEINPRLTTGYLLWRQLCEFNPAQLLLLEEPGRAPDRPLQTRPLQTAPGQDAQHTLTRDFRLRVSELV